jgi:DNA-binding transcriptional LysR family regulator
MFLRQFLYLVSLEEHGHFGRAAEHCHVSQPSLSSAIKQLETELGVPIILRAHRFQGFTEEGLRIVKWAKRILADKDAMLEELAIMRHNLQGRLRIGAMPMTSPVLPVINQLFTERHPGVQVDIQFISQTRLNLGLTNFELDVGVTYLSSQPMERLHSLPLYDERLTLLLPDNDWLKGRKTATWEEAAKLPLCLLSPSTPERQILDRAFASSGFVPQPRMESNSIFQLAFHVAAAKLATIIPSHFMEMLSACPGTRRMPLEKPVVTETVGLVWVEGDPMMPMAKAVIDVLTEATQSGGIEGWFPDHQADAQQRAPARRRSRGGAAVTGR